MANQITDNRTSVDTAEANTNFDDLAGSGPSGTADNEVFIQGSNSIGYYTTTTRAGLLYDAGSAQDWSGNVFYIWVNCGVVGLLDIKANGGCTIRFCGATVTDWFEVYVAGSDDWPPAVLGGWTQFVVDIDEAKSIADTNTWTNGTSPATTAIRYVGVTTVTSATMPRMVDNTWVDDIRRLPAATPGIIVEGRNGGTTDWDSADIYAQLGDAVGTFIPSAGGAWKINTPIQFGINDTTTHGFTDTNAVWLWDNAEFVPDDVYNISALGNSGGTTSVKFGTISGTGNSAIGSQGLVVSSAQPDGPRWSMDFDDPNLDTIEFGGCSFQHGATFQLDDPAVRVASCLYLDCTQAQVSNSDQVRNTVVNANTADGAAFMVTDDFADIAFCSFTFSDGHAIELTATTVDPQTNVGNTFSGYTNTTDSTDAAVYLSEAGNPNLTINSSDNSDLQTNSWRTLGTGTITINNNVSVTFDGLIANTEVRVYATSGGAELAGVENSGTSFVASIAAATNVYYTIHHKEYEHIRVENFTWPTNSTTIPIQQRFDDNYVNN